jgi:hypothetical protein
MADTDIYETFDYGYDPSIPEEAPLVAVSRPATLLSKASVNPDWLPPVGKQTSPSCFVWSSTYGMATYAAARANKRSASSPSSQASPTYTYIKVLEHHNVASGTCVGGHIAWPLNFLKTNGGTPSMAAASNESNCADTWSAYGTGTIAADPTFQVKDWAMIDITGTGGLDSIRALISQNTPLAYGTWLYTDFPHYNGTPSPYVGNGKPLYNKKTGKRAGHCMLIIGYDDSMGENGALLIQNSFGPEWGCQWNGNGGYIWMDCMTFQTLAQGNAFHITNM